MSTNPYALLPFTSCNAALQSSAPNAVISFYSDDPNLLSPCNGGDAWCCAGNSTATYRLQGCAGSNLTQAQVRALPPGTAVDGWCQSGNGGAGPVAFAPVLQGAVRSCR